MLNNYFELKRIKLKRFKYFLNFNRNNINFSNDYYQTQTLLLFLSINAIL